MQTQTPMNTYWLANAKGQSSFDSTEPYDGPVQPRLAPYKDVAATHLRKDVAHCVPFMLFYAWR
jgi:hypothetical protein